MDKFIGTILMLAVIVICFYIFMNLDKLNNIAIPIPDKAIQYFKVQPFNPSSGISTTTPEL